MTRQTHRQTVRAVAVATVLTGCALLAGCSQPDSRSTPPSGAARTLATDAVAALGEGSSARLRSLFPEEQGSSVDEVYRSCAYQASTQPQVSTDDTISPKLFNVRLTASSRTASSAQVECDFALIWTNGTHWEISLGRVASSPGPAGS